MNIDTAPASRNIRSFRPHQYLVYAGERQESIYRLEEGWACRFRLLSDGRRQITGLFLPGDYCEPQWALGGSAEQSVTALTNVRISQVPCARPRPSGEQGSRLEAGIARSLVTCFNRQSDWIVSLGRKNAIERLSELFCDLFDRMDKAGLVYGDQCAMPLTQIDLADIAGLTSVHVNRVLQDMRDRNLVELHSKWMRIPDKAALRRIALIPPGFDETKTAQKMVGANMG